MNDPHVMKVIGREEGVGDGSEKLVYCTGLFEKVTALEWTDFEQNRATIKDGAIHFILAVSLELSDI